MTKKMLLSILVIGSFGALAGVGTYAAFSGSTDNTGNRFVAGTVSVGDNDGGVASLYDLASSPQKPGQSTVKCIKVTYTGSLPADVKLYTTDTVGSSSQYVNLKIEKGTSDTSTFPNCGTYTAESTIFDGTVGGFASAKNSYENGVSAYPGTDTAWAQNANLVYRFTLSVQDTDLAQGANTGLHSFTWKAQSQ